MKIGVFDMGGSGWTGGLTYLRNLGHAVKTTIPDELNLFLVRIAVAGRAEEDWVSNYFDGVIEVVPFGRSRYSPLKFIQQATALLAGGDILNARRFEKKFRHEGVEALFGLHLTNRFTLPSVGWFGDFQHIDLPEFFGSKDILLRNLMLKRMIHNCTLMVFSSQHAKNRFLQLHPGQAAKARVLSFVAHLPEQARTIDPAYLMQKHNIPEKFIYLPNQLWKHKNHLTVLRAMKILADRADRTSMVCSGNLNDGRNPDHKENVFRYIRENNLSGRVFMLGMVDFADVHALIRQSCCVLNPSLYEGWSTTVEETKTIGKPMILSDIEVHREQNPPETIFFEPKNADMLAETMEKAWHLHPAGPNRQMEEAAVQDYPKRSKRFAQTFAEICREAANLNDNISA